MLVIALDTSTPAVTAGLVELDASSQQPPRTLAERVTVNPRAHGELLVPHLMEAAHEAGRALHEACAVVCGCGPGPFTGLRVGMVTAASLGHALELPVHPVCGLDAVAAATPEQGPLLVVTDARRKELYWAVYASADASGATRRRLDGPHVDRPDRVAERAAEHGARDIAGEVAERYSAELGLSPAGASAYPTPAGVVAVAAESVRSGARPDPLVAIYLRHPDAQEPGPPKQASTPFELSRERW